MGNKNNATASTKKIRRKNLIGQRFGKLTVLEYDRNTYKWLCRCDCGNLCAKSAGQLNAGLAKSCGCGWHPASVRTGMRFGRLVAVSPTDQRSAKAVVWECRCDCGQTVFLRSTMLASGHTTSCGCVKQEQDKLKDFKNILTYTDGTCIEFVKNIGKRRVNTSSDTGVRGVVLKDGKYQAHIQFRKKRYYLGRYTDLEDAVAVRKQAESIVTEYLETYLAGDVSADSSLDFKELFERKKTRNV